MLARNDFIVNNMIYYTENPNLEDTTPPPPPTAQWEHGRGLKICTNPGLVMTIGAIEAIFDIPS